jgi:hypothetical protein
MVEKLPSTPRHTPPIQPLFGPPVDEVGQPTYAQNAYEQPDARQAPSADVPVTQATLVVQPVVAARPAPAEAAREPVQEPLETVEPEVTVVSHSSLFYWWPVWAVGYLMAIITLVQGQTIEVGKFAINIHSSNNLGVFFFLTLFLTILISNVVVRGLASALVLMGIVLMTVVFAYFQWWDTILGWIGELTIFLNQGAYFWFSTLMFVVWAFTVFFFDRMSCWRFKPGQLTHEVVIGASSRTYDTENMTFEKRRDDVFRHWLLGMGSGDLIVNSFSAGHPEEIHIPNVLFIGYKIQAIQRLIAMRPAEIERPTSRK